MSLLDWLLSLFRPSKPKVLSVRVADLSAELRARFSDRSRDLEDAFVRRGATVKYLLKQLRAQVLALEPDVEGVNERASKIISSSTKNASRSLLNLTDSLQPPAQASAVEWRDYAYRSLSALQTASSSLGKSVAIASLGQKNQFQQMGGTISELVTEFEAVRAACQQNPWIDEAQAIEIAIAGLPDPLPLARDARKLQSELGSFEENLVRAREAMARFEAKPDFVALSKITTRIDELKSRETELRSHVSSLFGPLEKPWRKWTTDSNLQSRLSGPTRDTLAQLFKNPLDTLYRESKSGSIEHALSEWKALADADATGDFEKLRKQLDALLALDFFKQYFWPLNEVQVEKSRLEKSLSDSPLYPEQKRLAQAVENAERQLAQAKIEFEHLEKRLGKARLERVEQLASLAEKLEKLIGAKVDWVGE